MNKSILVIALACMMAVCLSCEKSGTATDDNGGGDASGAMDLGLSVKWASCNLGASKPEEEGDYYAWGEVSPKKVFSKENYKFYVGTDDYGRYQVSKYNIFPQFGKVDNKTQLEPEDDAAHAKLGGNWRIPTRADWQELRDKCIWTFQLRMKVPGFEIKSSVNGQSIFLPITGYYINEDYYYSDECCYWTSTLKQKVSETQKHLDVYFLFIDDSPDIYFESDSRYFGNPIRPVKGK